jgi:hypothetical protein
VVVVVVGVHVSEGGWAGGWGVGVAVVVVVERSGGGHTLAAGLCHELPQLHVDVGFALEVRHPLRVCAFAQDHLPQPPPPPPFPATRQCPKHQCA